MDTNPHTNFLKNVFQNINYYLLIPRAISEAPKSKKDERIRIWGKSYGRANVHRCVKKCPVRDNQLFSHFTMKNDGNNLLYVLLSLEET